MTVCPLGTNRQRIRNGIQCTVLYCTWKELLQSLIEALFTFSWLFKWCGFLILDSKHFCYCTDNATTVCCLYTVKSLLETYTQNVNFCVNHTLRSMGVQNTHFYSVPMFSISTGRWLNSQLLFP